MGLAVLAPRRGDVRVVLHLDLEEDVDNGVGLFNLGCMERIVWFKVCASAFAGYTTAYDAGSYLHTVRRV